MKNPNGFGTVTKLSGKRRKPWIVKVTVGFDNVTGKQIQKSLGTFKERKDALKCLSLYNANKTLEGTNSEYTMAIGQSIQKEPKEKHTFGECALATIERDKDKRSTSWLKLKKFAVKRLTNIMDINIDKLDLFTIQKEFDAMKHENMSPSSLNACKVLCSESFKYAVMHKYISINDDYTKYIDISCNVEREPIHKPFNNSEINILVSDDSLESKIIRVYILTGCRACELLKAKKIDDYILCGSKTKAGKNRKIPIHSHIEPFIDEVLEYLKDKKYNTMYSLFKLYCETKFSSTHNIHDTRYTFATLGKESRMKPTAIKKIMGHRINDLTDDVYTHESIEYLKDEIEKIKL